MNARAYALTADALSGALTSLRVEPTLADAAEWGQSEHRYQHFLWAIEALWGIPESTPLWEAKVFLVREIAREESKREHSHYSFNGNRLVAAKQMLEHIEAFESRNRSAA